MSNENNLWGRLSKKIKSTSVTIPAKKITAKPAQKATATPAVKSVKVKPAKAPKVKAQAHVQLHPPTNTPVYQNVDFKFMTSISQAGISILTNFHGNLIHKFTLPNTDYALWIGLYPQQKYNYVQVRVRPNEFWGDANLIHAVILTIINVLDALFAEANRVQQQQRRM